MFFGKVTEKNHKRSLYQKVEIFIQKLNINGLHKGIQNIRGRYNYYIQKVEYIVNLDFIGESYGKK